MNKKRNYGTTIKRRKNLRGWGSIKGNAETISAFDYGDI